MPVIPFPIHLRQVLEYYGPADSCTADQATTYSAPPGAVVRLTGTTSQLRPCYRGFELDFTMVVSVNQTTICRTVLTGLYPYRRGETLGAPPDRPTSNRRKPESFAEQFDEWTVPVSTGWRYARASGDYNPFHLHAVAGKLFGFRGAVAHGMWTLARSIAALQSRPDWPLSASIVQPNSEVPSVPCARIACEFKRPLIMPSRVRLVAETPNCTTRPASEALKTTKQPLLCPPSAVADRRSLAVRKQFAVYSADGRELHIVGQLQLG